LRLAIGKMKNDQTGEKAFGRSVYANPLSPEICPILAFAVVVFMKGYVRGGGTRRIFGEGFKSRFSKWLGNILRDHKDELLALGLVVTELGTHSLRKGVATMVSSFPGGPDSVSVFLRAGWSLGSVAKRYIFACTGGDQYVGRCATGLCMNDDSFAVLPPHFDPEGGPALTVHQWEEVLPGYSEMPDGFRSTAPFLLASLIYHQDFITATFPRNHALFATPIWTQGHMQRLKQRVLAGNMINRISGLQATGIPPHVVLNRGIHDLKQAQEEFEGHLKSMNESFRENTASVLEQIKAGFNDLPKAVSESVLRNCEVTGAVGVTRDQVEQITEDNFSAIGIVSIINIFFF
jgi:hypothetical protein